MQASVKGNLKKICIAGDGQLARFLALSARKYPSEISFLSKDKLNSPCRDLGQVIETQHWNDLNALKNFVTGADVLLLENEFIPHEFLQYAQTQGIECFPNYQSYSKLNTKFKQFNLAQKYDINVPAFHLEKCSVKLFAKLSKTQKPLMLKATTNGYDGRGNFSLHADHCDHNALKDFLTAHQEILVQDFLHFDEEVAFMCLVDRDHNVTFFPCAQTLQENNICHMVLAPVKKPLEDIHQKLKNLFFDIKAVGLFGVELFLKDDEFYFNEIAPRPHNSAHFTMDACDISQFDALLSLVFNEAIQQVKMTSPSALMINLLGRGAYHQERLSWKNPLEHVHDSNNFFVHLYNKTQSSLGRKMGHITLLGKDTTSLLPLAHFIKDNYEI